MIKFNAVDRATGRTMLGLGLSAKNVEKLKDGQPIVFHADPYGIPNVDILIMYGETEEAMTGDLVGSGLLDRAKDASKIHDDPQTE